MSDSRQLVNVEFDIVATEDLFLTGSCKTIKRVNKGTAYPCQMQKTQSFNSLFRHYAKHNGLSKEDLIFYFVDLLGPDETPESVHLMSRDEVWVQHRKSNSPHPIRSHTECPLGDCFRKVLSSNQNTDITFVVGEGKEEILAHKIILAARSDYFAAMLCDGRMQESITGVVNLRNHNADTFKLMLEFIYTAHIRIASELSCDTLCDLISLANEFLLTDLLVFCQTNLQRLVTMDNICDMLKFCHKLEECGPLKEHCFQFVADNLADLRERQSFRDTANELPSLSLYLVDYLANPAQKKRRLLSPDDST
mmetsp:Transcript_23985/g.35203  ORF Transcript_23985/g.35203 Transcript_23985/m.35203 type:complete len:308 (+) Transcript_23985:105-1028(+)